VYSRTFKFRLLKIQEICPLKCFILPLNAPKCIWWPLADPLAELKGRGGEKGESGKREGEGREGDIEQVEKGRGKGNV